MSAILQFRPKSSLSSFVASSQTTRPWGGYEVLHEDVGYKIKRLSIESKAKTSLQLHRKRAEHWHIETGVARVKLGKATLILRAGDSLDIPVNMLHRIENVGKTMLRVLEVQIGDYLDEDDIIRLHDIYGRV